jgi:argininosuccinate lyase
MQKLWGGAFAGDSAALVDAFGSSLASDLTFWREDIEGSIAHARMLGAQGIIPAESAGRIVGGLERILEEGPDTLPRDAEDIHTAVEIRLTELIGEDARRLHTGRSRNDQVALDGRLWLRRQLRGMQDEVRALQAALLRLDDRHGRALLPGMTHQQHAQPIRLALWIYAHAFALQRHGWRLARMDELLDASPLGSAALSGSDLPLDRQATADSLGFSAPMANALDATSDRSWALDGLHVCTLIMIDLSRLCQELVLWSAPEYGWVRLAEETTTGSSIMPQKRNPDMAELIRGRAGRAIGGWTGLAATMKGLILGYNRDTQEDKPPLFAAAACARDSLRIAALMVDGLTVAEERMAAACTRDFSTATDLANALARAGVPFRDAHEQTGRIVRLCQERGIGLEDLGLDDLRSECPAATEEMRARLQPEASADARDTEGGCGPRALARQRERLDVLLAAPFDGPQ